ncbi:hypothetical protein N7448_002386 [Penicillium atrosanguineum]|uniref:Uncharacterized protein n=1 Tax=Penicillium atrosanguineum TaxID=1132637 RepID=A0A9W9HEB8_9EURO|nr:uncharacterized protein N7443_005788 [Penicillium atrosanguineum]KAJ5128669.1 hypothetical protein N7526_006835 [Penicillium atrosanguineum]KAJ5144994.1 hypothetical protein N7448_002386 [Penicillium atrosanguineum]KAJ5300786.1 hypothetical protein N7443_005788 [Penicillium atrosanguineum]KAJ5311428.1 hypothetical protein N7476_007288 [Penicillium atrosanguineum]
MVFVPCKQAAVLMFGVASLALSAAINHDAVQNRDGKVAEPVQFSPDCSLFYRIQIGDTCWDIITRNENTFTIKQLMCWNPDINPNCSNLIPGRDICVGVINPLYC